MRARILAGVLVLVTTAGVASTISSGGSGGGGGSSPVDVLAALVGQPVVANSYRATAATGPAFFADGILDCVLDLGAGTNNCLGTNLAGDILLGPDNGGTSTVVRVSGTVRAQAFSVANGYIDSYFNSIILNSFPTKPVMIVEEEGLQINGGTPIKGYLVVPVTFDSAAISNNTCNPQAVTVAGAQTGDFVSVNVQFTLPSGIGIQGARVTAANTVELNICNNTAGGALDPASGTYLFKLER